MCLPNLPDPDTVTAAQLRDVYSFGTRQARIGSKSFRSHVSSNRESAFDSLVALLSQLRGADHHVLVISWYSEFYHDMTCKAHRTKPVISFF